LEKDADQRAHEAAPSSLGGFANNYGSSHKTASIISIALLEEIELLMSYLQQLFEHAELWSSYDYASYCDLKDYTIFALPKLLTYLDTEAIMPASATEQHMATITPGLLLD